MKMDELLKAARDLADEARKLSFHGPEAILVAAILIEIREMRAKAENRDEEA